MSFSSIWISWEAYMLWDSRALCLNFLKSSAFWCGLVCSLSGRKWAHETWKFLLLFFSLLPQYHLKVPAPVFGAWRPFSHIIEDGLCQEFFCFSFFFFFSGGGNKGIIWVFLRYIYIKPSSSILWTSMTKWSSYTCVRKCSAGNGNVQIIYKLDSFLSSNLFFQKKCQNANVRKW